MSAGINGTVLLDDLWTLSIFPQVLFISRYTLTKWALQHRDSTKNFTTLLIIITNLLQKCHVDQLLLFSPSLFSTCQLPGSFYEIISIVTWGSWRVAVLDMALAAISFKVFSTIMGWLIKFEAVYCKCRIFSEDMSGNCKIWIDSCQRVLAERNGLGNWWWLISIFCSWHHGPGATVRPRLSHQPDRQFFGTAHFIVSWYYAAECDLNEADMTDWCLIEVTPFVSPYIFNVHAP